GLIRKGDATGCESMTTSATRGRPVALGIDTAPLRDGKLACERHNAYRSFLTRINHGVKRLLCPPEPCSAPLWGSRSPDSTALAGVVARACRVPAAHRIILLDDCPTCGAPGARKGQQMKIAVCVKYVPVVAQIGFDYVTKTILREGVPS